MEGSSATAEPGQEQGARRSRLVRRLEMELAQARGGLLVTARETVEGLGADLGELLSKSPCPVLVVG